jgi:hydrogenase maturation protease
MKPGMLVCGFGNRLRSDDGLGGRVIERLSRTHQPGYVILKDYGTSFFRAALEIGDYRQVIAVDAIQAGGRPGTIYRRELARWDVVNIGSPVSFATSLHEEGLGNALATAAAVGHFPEKVVILGCEPGDISLGLGQSRAVMSALDRLLKLVRVEIENGRVFTEPVR